MSYAEAARKQWEALVYYALALPERGYEDRIRALAGEVGTSFGVLKRKCDAIRDAHYAKGLDFDAIVALGQGKTLSVYAQKRAKYAEKTRIMKIRIPSSMYDAIQNPHASPDQEEPLMQRLHRLLGIKTWSEFWEFTLAMYGNATDDAIIHEGGEHPGKKKRR